jgi:hypothetical protein
LVVEGVTLTQLPPVQYSIRGLLPFTLPTAQQVPLLEQYTLFKATLTLVAGVTRLQLVPFQFSIKGLLLTAAPTAQQLLVLVQ